MEFDKENWGRVYLSTRFHGGYNQRFQMLGNGEIACKGSERHVRYDLRLDVFESSTHNGAHVGVHPAQAKGNQDWTIRNA